ncbi:uncharacterized protein LOC109022059 [Juglans regia]|uniref:Uncharacterized protein LOC109022059 n=1 Tax=Juglans regia TaxID=51240 RepID=A0A6P9ERS0_JUGRE|nr:uncharacterized protein LOC109022059 [Juglans regia]
MNAQRGGHRQENPGRLNMATNMISSTIVPEVLRNDNYATWSACIKNYFLAQDLWDIFETTTKPSESEDCAVEFKAWMKKNAAALHAIQISCSVEILSQINPISSAKDVWDSLYKLMNQPPSKGVNPMAEKGNSSNISSSGIHGDRSTTTPDQKVEVGSSSNNPDIALDLIKKYPDLALTPDRSGRYSPIFALASMPTSFPSGKPLVFWKKWIYSCIHIQLENGTSYTNIEVQEDEECQSNEVKTNRSSDHGKRHKGNVNAAIFRAIKKGAFEFVQDVLRANPELLWIRDGNSRNIFSYAVLCRQAEIFSLIYGIDMKNRMALEQDSSLNNILHMAGMPPVSNMLDDIYKLAQLFKSKENYNGQLTRNVVRKTNIGQAKNQTLGNKARIQPNEESH